MSGMASRRANEVDQYIQRFPVPVRAILAKIRAIARQAAPHAQEVISYRMPALKQEGILIYYGAFRRHIGIFPPVRGNTALKRSLARFMGPRGNLQLPFDQPVPYVDIGKFVRWRVSLLRQKRGANRAAKRPARRRASDAGG
jgi:uncharacterized protein YdhG (YjbR/CyaY superfamily)